MTTYAIGQGNYQATSFKCSAKHKVEREAKTKKIDSRIEKILEAPEKENTLNGKLAEKPEEKNLDLVMENNEWAASLADKKNDDLDSISRWD